MTRTITKKDYYDGNFKLSREIEGMLKELRVYHNKPYKDLVSILIENAYRQMSEATNIDKTNELEKQRQQVDFQVQQLTLMFGYLKSEFESVKAENFILKERTETLSKKSSEISNLLSTSAKDLQDCIDKVKGELDKEDTDIKATLEKHKKALQSLINKDKDSGGILSSIFGIGKD